MTAKAFSNEWVSTAVFSILRSGAAEPGPDHLLLAAGRRPRGFHAACRVIQQCVPWWGNDSGPTSFVWTVAGEGISLSFFRIFAGELSLSSTYQKAASNSGSWRLTTRPLLGWNSASKSGRIRWLLVSWNRIVKLTGFLKVPVNGTVAFRFDKSVRVLNLCQGIRQVSTHRTSIFCDLSIRPYLTEPSQCKPLEALRPCGIRTRQETIAVSALAATV